MKFATHGPHSKLDKNFTRPNRGQRNVDSDRLNGNSSLTVKIRSTFHKSSETMSVNACTHTRHRHGDRTSFRRCTLYYKNMLSISCSQTFDGKACEESRRETKAERICVSPFPSSSWNEKTKGK